jgi:hypothetical protein
MLTVVPRFAAQPSALALWAAIEVAAAAEIPVPKGLQ